MKHILLLVLIAIFSCASAAHADIPKEKRAEIEKMLRLTGAEKLMDQIRAQMIIALKKEMKNVPETFLDKFQTKIDTHELLEQIIPLYDKYYTLEDLKAVNAFYETPAGQKVVATLPQIMQESIKIGQEWGEKIGKQAAAEAMLELYGK